jgi:hypothetical protein
MKAFLFLLLVSVALISAGCTGPAEKTAASSYFIDVHEFGPGKVSAADVAEAHQKDLAVEGEFGVRFLNYWVDELNGKVLCLSEAPSADAVRETHRKAHGLLPGTFDPVSRAK